MNWWNARGFFLATLAASTMFFSACGPSLKSTMLVPQVKLGKKAEPLPESTYIYIDELKDVRESKAIARREKKDVNPDGEVSPAVVDALKQALATKGFSYSESAPVIISGEIRDWVAEVTGSLPTKVNANAAIFIEILDPANKRIYSGVYRGFASMDGASVNEEDVRKTLASAMEEAVMQVSADKQLVTLLGSF